MCTHVAYLGSEQRLDEILLTPSHGLVMQAIRPARQRFGFGVNGDGFGVGWYLPDVTRLAEELPRGVLAKLESPQALVAAHVFGLLEGARRSPAPWRDPCPPVPPREDG